MNARALGVVVSALALACSSGTRPCTPQNCTGCCDSAQVCQSSANATCGLNGVACVACSAGGICTAGVCSGGSGGGSGVGGGDATGGGAAAGGGVAGAGGGGGGGGTATGGGAGTGGGAASGKANVMLLLDKSGSMSSPLNQTMSCGTCVFPNCNENSCPTRMGAMRSGLTTFLTEAGTTARYGLTVYPADTVCTPAGSQQQLVAITPAGDTDPQLQAWSDMVKAAAMSVAPAGGTPTAASLDFVGTIAELNDTSRRRFVVLLTDGLPNCNAANPNTCTTPTTCKCTLSGGNCGTVVNDTDPNNFCRRGCLDATAAQAAVMGLRARGIVTVVVGFGADLMTNPDGVAVLGSMSTAGGWSRTCTGTAPCSTGNPCNNGTCAQSFYTAGSAVELVGVLNEIAGRL